jgi:hypothetical protein
MFGNRAMIYFDGNLTGFDIKVDDRGEHDNFLTTPLRKAMSCLVRDTRLSARMMDLSYFIPMTIQWLAFDMITNDAPRMERRYEILDHGIWNDIPFRLPSFEQCICRVKFPSSKPVFDMAPHLFDRNGIWALYWPVYELYMHLQ